jgi:hypothetical protein
MSYPPLPTLDEAELAARFGSNREALSRYRLLAAILVQGVPQREAAANAGVSERTARNILRAFRQHGLAALAGPRPGARRAIPRRWERFEPALAQALAADPQAGGDRLWRRAQALLGPDGPALSRRTAYRILSRLRASTIARDGAEDRLGTLRAALTLLPEDPPLTLGTSLLAQELFPETGDPLVRGTMLQQALRAALDRLRPAGEVSTIDRNWWPYLICTGEYEAGQVRADLQRDLALSASTYSRAKRQGLRQIAQALPRIVAGMAEAPATLASQRLPRSADFVGRREEQSYYAWRLQTEGIAWLWGPPGSGKTALAAELAAEGRRYGQTILWHTCRPGADATAAGIAAGLLVAAGVGAAGDSPLEQLHTLLLERAAVVILDNTHIAGAEAAPVIAMLTELARQRAARALVISRQRPPNDDTWPALPGLCEAEARLLWAGAPALPPEQWRALYKATGGLPAPLRLVATALCRAGGLARPDDWRATVADWAEGELWRRLDDNQQHAAALVRALEGRPWLPQAELVLRALDLAEDDLRRLFDLGLASAEGERIALHPALAASADGLLAREARLGRLLATLAGTLTEPAGTDGAALAAAMPPAPPAEPPAGLALLVRLDEALAHSAAYLERRTARDKDARRLADELTLLRAALPSPAGMGARPRRAASAAR